MFKNWLVICLSGCLLVQTMHGQAASSALAQRVDKDFIEVGKKAIPAVVFVKVKGVTLEDSDPYGDLQSDDFFKYFFSPRKQEHTPISGQASGFIISPEGYILTNNHVVDGAKEIKVILNDGREFTGKLVGQDPNTDIAVIKIDANHLPYLELGDSHALEVGQFVVAIGNPFGLQASLTVGVVSAKGRDNLDLAPVENFIQTDASINRGNSGGPLLNLDAKVVGMNTAIVAYSNIGFAIPSNMIRPVKDQLIRDGKTTHSYIGVVLQEITQQLAEALGIPRKNGVLVANVSKGSPAEKAGIQQGDIIEMYNKLPVESIGGLRTAITVMTPGTKINLSIMRHNKKTNNFEFLEVPVEVTLHPNTKQQGAPSNMSNKLGFQVQEIASPEQASMLGLPAEIQGIVISKVEPNSPAALAGLKRGVQILAINKKEVHTLEEYESALQSTPKDRPVLLLIKKGNMEEFISIKVS